MSAGLGSDAVRDLLRASFNEQFGPIVGEKILSGEIDCQHLCDMEQRALAEAEIAFRRACLEVAGLAQPAPRD